MCGITCIAGAFVPEKVFWIQIILFLVGKMAITSAFTIVYVYSGEFWLKIHEKLFLTFVFSQSRNAANFN